MSQLTSVKIPYTLKQHWSMYFAKQYNNYYAVHFIICILTND